LRKKGPSCPAKPAHPSPEIRLFAPAIGLPARLIRASFRPAAQGARSGDHDMNKASLIGQLQIDRGSGPGSGDGPSARFWWILGGILAVILLAAAIVVFAVVQPGKVPVTAAVAKAAAASGGAIQGASLLDASGYVVARRQATVSSKITGRVLEVMIEEGQHVLAGQIIARLDASNYKANLDEASAQEATAKANLKVAQISADLSGPRYKRNQEIHARGFLSEQAVEDAKGAYETAQANLDVAKRQVAGSHAALEVAQRNLADTVVTAPFSGVVTVKAAQPGEIVSPISAGGGFTRTGICTIVDMDSLEVEVDVAESFINRVSAGMAATVKLDAYPDWSIPAEVIAVIPTADRSKATVTVRVGLKQKDARIVPEMGARVAFLAPADTSAGPTASSRSVTVPPDAVQTEGDQAVVYVISDGKVERRAVRLGAKTDQGQVLLAGVSAGETIAVAPQGKLKDGSAVRIVKKPASDQSAG
jgi:RND family efflux transporter MFP subunit